MRSTASGRRASSIPKCGRLTSSASNARSDLRRNRLFPSVRDDPMTPEPADRFYESQGLRLHYVDWGNEAAPPLILVHGGLDHCRNWDAIARELHPHFRIMAPDLRGHGDSEWAKGSSYSLVDHVYDLSRLIRFAELRDPAIVGHSLGGMISLAYAGTYPDRVSRLAVLDGAFLSGSRRTPIHEQMSRWIDQLDRISEREPSAFRSEPIRIGYRALPCWTEPFCPAPDAHRFTSRCRDGSTNSIASPSANPARSRRSRRRRRGCR